MSTRENERSELHKAIWDMANQLRGSVDGWDFKQYVLGMLFYRFISENICKYISEVSGDSNIDYALMKDDEAEIWKNDIVEEKWFFIYPSELFVNVVKRAKNDENLNETLLKIFKNIESSAHGTESESDIKGLFDDFNPNSPKLWNSVEQRNKKLADLLESVNNLKFGDFKENSIDAFGDAYEYLMKMYASNAGKSGGEFFTPQEVSELLAEITTIWKNDVNKVYDPCCGSGSLLLKFAKVLWKENVWGFYGQEINLTTYNLCRINMFLHDINYHKFDISHGDTLLEPTHFDEEPFDAIVSNPPYSIKWEWDANPILINDERFSKAWVLAPKSKADMAFVMHILSWLSEKWTAAIVEFPGVLYRGWAEQKIRKYLVDNNYVDAVIQLPPDLFFGTSIATCILVLKKSSKVDNNILFIDASAEFVRWWNKNVLLEENRKKILEAIKNRENIEYFANLVPNSDVGKNDYNLSVSSYVEQEDTREKIDIKELNEKIREIVSKQLVLRDEIEKIITEIEAGFVF